MLWPWAAAWQWTPEQRWRAWRRVPVWSAPQQACALRRCRVQPAVGEPEEVARAVRVLEQRRRVRVEELEEAARRRLVRVERDGARRRRAQGAVARPRWADIGRTACPYRKIVGLLQLENVPMTLNAIGKYVSPL